VAGASPATLLARTARTLLAATALLAACKGGDGGPTAPPSPGPALAGVGVSLFVATVQVGQSTTAVATGLDQNGALMGAGVITWTSANPAIAMVSALGIVTGVAPGQTQIVATGSGKTGQAALTVVANQEMQCPLGATLQLRIGEVATLNAAQVASLCLGIAGLPSEYVLIPFGNSATAASTVSLQVTGTQTQAILTPPLASQQAQPAADWQRTGMSALVGQEQSLPDASMEGAFRARERRELAALGALRATASRAPPTDPSRLTGVPATPVVGSVVSINSKLTGGGCDAKQLSPARVVAVLRHTIVLIDQEAPAGGFTDAELVAFGTSFDTLGYPLDTLNFGSPADIDGNGRVAIFFTPGVNRLPGPPGSFIGGLFYGRDLFPATGAAACPGSNEGELFYMAVPDPPQTINGNYRSKAALSNLVLATLVHEFQHLINASRRMFVNNAASISEEPWLNEGLSHIAEELLYYRMSGNSARANISLEVLRSSPAQVDAFNTYVAQNFARLAQYLAAPSTNSPFAQTDGLAMRGAIWELLRYSADRKGGDERNTWFALANSSASGQANFNAVFGDIVASTRDWAVAQFLDDSGLLVADKYTYPSWDFRSIYPALTNPSRFLLATSSLVDGAPVTLQLNGGAAAYVRFRVPASVAANVACTSAGRAVPASVDFILVRTQ
jgi:hypothetical protein